MRALKLRCAKQYYPSTKECIKSPLSCLNNCNKRGTCVSGFCHCRPGHYGADCSLSLGPDGKPVLLAGSGYTTRAKRPWVYVYELPPALLTWTNTKRLDRSTHLHFYQRLLSSGARVADGDLADWYFIPIRQRQASDSDFLADAVEYVRHAYPWWNKTNGERHFIIHTGDLGTDELQFASRYAAANVTWLTRRGDPGIPNPGHFKHFGLEHTPLHPLVEKKQRNTTFFFAGRICGDRQIPRNGVWPNCGPRSRGYSAGVRQYVHYHHWNRTGFRVVTHEPRYGAALASSRFCLAPLGGGHGQRQIIVSAMGCVPVSIADDVFEPFEPQIDWTRFALRPKEADIPRLHELIAAITPAQYAEMQTRLRCAAQHFFYSSIVGGLFGEDGRYDAFESTLEVLRVKALHPTAPPQDYRRLDPDFDAFMDCRDPPGFKVSGPAPDQYNLLSGKGSSAAAARKAAGGQQGGAQAENPLCSHNIMDRGRLPCERFVQGSSKTHGLQGGVVCARTRPHLASCPRIWL
ncbi:hypothetical protein GPECTOR_56g385 [Gonium pectorale]|uniref:EGF-like domain-containing protein n=1 Tax=Gonium pectorale TaxID=33097 RepID=A0A150G5Y0_GONPE|nr:hypothetical protein GPECTOR_56g385 [Gonium pectorale]|eukprot:KXZ45289.1 hypothetical protein GPECTOR_56g385 [Gonium pectorale]